NNRPVEKRLGIAEYQVNGDLSCVDSVLRLAQEASILAEEVQHYQLNITGTSGLYWMLHKYPEEHSWAWLMAASHERVMRKVQHYLVRLQTFAVGDEKSCLSANFRTAMMNAVVQWKRLTGDFSALLWNGVAFGILGDVTSWREVDENGTVDPNEPGGPPPNVSWSENIIFGNMWLSSVQKWLEYHSQEIGSSAYNELGLAQQAQKQGLQYAWGKAGNQNREPSAVGVLSSFEFLRRQLFAGWSLDKGLLRGFLRHCLQPGFGAEPTVSVAEFGSGGGRYSQWLNDTGLVQALAYDSTLAVGDITGGSVQEVDLSKEGAQLSRSFEWVLCLDVVSRLPAAQAAGMLRSIRRHAIRGAVISWDAAVSSEQDFVALVQLETGFVLDGLGTQKLRAGCELPQLAAGATVFRAA
ncbi:unnamed protein product, partial [Polarella glacialis]